MRPIAAFEKSVQLFHDAQKSLINNLAGRPKDAGQVNLNNLTGRGQWHSGTVLTGGPKTSSNKQLLVYKLAGIVYKLDVEVNLGVRLEICWHVHA